ncbi:MAG TPA: hypothetical protein VK034_24340 [Enhygromyxa sp.]|nr:hypothetical protein [Enhygromyxa sp.]
MTKHDVEQILTRLACLALIAGSFALSGCVLWMRDPEFYQQQLGELLEDHSEPIEACYDRYLSEHDANARGSLVVDFTVEKGTGRITDIEVDSSRSTVPERLAACVVDQLAQLRFEPADARTARASHGWEFVRGSPKRPPADPFAGATMAMLGCYSSHLAEVDREAQGDLVVDYAFNRETGAVERLDVIEEATTAPQPVVECATAALESARLDPEQLEDRNAAGRRSFALRYQPYREPG